MTQVVAKAHADYVTGLCDIPLQSESTAAGVRS